MKDKFNHRAKQEREEEEDEKKINHAIKQLRTNQCLRNVSHRHIFHRTISCAQHPRNRVLQRDLKLNEMSNNKQPSR